MNHFEHTIAAISTPCGTGGISVVRVSGEKAIEISDKIFMAYDGTILKSLSGYRAKFGKILYKNKPIDEGVALVFKKPKSYTGEDIVEISCHGGVCMTSCLLRSFLELGATLAQPGEFTKRAFLNGKISLEKAESVIDLISSNYEKALKMSSSTFFGSLGKKIEDIKFLLIDVVSDLNAEIDYPDEGIKFSSDKVIDKKISKIIYDIEGLLDSYNTGSIIKNGLRTSIIGSPNAGKSTLMNLISKKEKSIVTDIPGTTRDAIEDTVIFGNIPIILVDTAGIRETDDKIEKIGVEKAIDIAKQSDLVLFMLDCSSSISNDEIEFITKSINKNKTILIINKTDLNEDFNDKIFEKHFKKRVFLSAKTGKGLKKLESTIVEFANFSSVEDENLIITNERHHDILSRALNLIRDVDLKAEKIPSDILADLIKEVLEILAEFNGENVEQSIVDSIFSKFCIGK
ncbi:MAG: tRNA uridine-5-carboxymethylaminomethyl(34) synthesis GTPase MnmE [Firmicutes bacterium]|nr:tRNA uridine-5-carboxymethylaminomethyl(34) synthesis GTPase MnmE [Bacillota bacterium]